MKSILLALFIAVAALPAMAADAPMEIAGLRLGADIKQFQAKVEPGKTETEITRPYVTTAAMTPVPGFRSGYVTYGNCASPGRILRIKMNYENDSREFYEDILAALKKRYGAPQQWRGNPFGTLKIWKWSVKDKGLGDISVILQHYSGDDDSFTKGNSIRIAAPGLFKEEQACQKSRQPERQSPPAAPGSAGLDLDHFLPR